MANTDRPAARQLLFLAHRLPYPPNKGEKIRAFHEIRLLWEQGWSVHAVTLVDDPSDESHVHPLRQWCASVRAETISPRLRKVAALRGPLSGRAITIPYFYSARLQRWVDRILESRPIEAVLCYCSPMAEYVFRSRVFDQLPSKPRLVMDLVDVDSDKWAQYARSATAPARWVYALEAKLLRAYERKVAARFDAILLTSEAEAELFRRLTGRRQNVLGVGNGVDLEYFHPGAQLAEEENSPLRLVFCGVMDYPPNVDAVTWFARNVLPIIRQEFPSTEFWIVGARPSGSVAQLADIPGVVVTGRVDDVRSYVRSAAISVAPIRIARGVQNKVLEAMAMGKPVVATPQAFEGIDATSGEDLLVAEPEPHEFAGAVCALLRDPRRRIGVGRAARMAVEQRYRWDVQMEPLLRLVGERQRAVGGGS